MRLAREQQVAWFALTVIVATVIGVVLAMRPPDPVSARAAATRFSSTRAMVHMPALTRSPHPIGTTEQQQVATYLAAQLRQQGFQPNVVSSTVANPRLGTPVPVGRLTTVVGRLKGTNPTGTVYLEAHYDSVRIGPGASDNGVAVATLLEVAGALHAGPRLRNDVVLVFTDGEEDGLLGARQVLDAGVVDPTRSVVVNLDARGTHGPLVAFETSTNNSRLLDEMANAPLPLAFSLGYEVYRRLPNATDFTELRLAGVPGINVAFLDGSPRYHTAEDTPAHVDQATLQHDGELNLALARGFGSTDLGHVDGSSSTFFWVPGLLVHYPNALVWPLAVLALGAVAFFIWYARSSLHPGHQQRGVLRWGRLSLSVAWMLATMVAAPLLASVVWWLMTLVRPGYAALLLGDTYRPGASRLGFIVLPVAVMLASYLVLRRRLGPVAMLAAGLAWLALLGVLLAAAAPGASYLFAVPALVGAGAGLVTLRWPAGSADPFARQVAAPAAQLAACLVTALLAVPVIDLLLPALGLAGAAVPALFTVLLCVPALPLLESALGEPINRAVRRWVPVAAGGLALTLLVAGLSVDGFSAADPRPSSMLYALDADTGAAQWLSADPVPSSWAARLAPGPPRPVHAQWPNLVYPFVTEYESGPARPATLAPPQLSVVEQSVEAGARSVRLTVRSARAAPVVSVWLASGGPQLTAATVDGVAVPASVVVSVPGVWGWSFVFKDLPAEGIVVALAFARAGPVRVRVIDETDGIAGLPGFQPRPSGVGLTPLPTDVTCVGRTFMI